VRPTPRGRVSRGEALAIGLVLAAWAVHILAVTTNVAAAALLALFQLELDEIDERGTGVLRSDEREPPRRARPSRTRAPIASVR